MKFTKENVEAVINDYFRQAGFESCDDLIAEIHNLDDTPEKVVVPKCFDEWFKEICERGPLSDARKQFALWKICQFGFGSYLQNVNGEDIKNYELSTWVSNNRMLAIDAVLNGYEVEEEPLYYIPLPHLKTSDGIQQVLSQRENCMNYFASTPHKILKQRFTKEELAQVPEIYKLYAKLIEEEDE